jgi:hypothetical protein
MDIEKIIGGLEDLSETAEKKEAAVAKDEEKYEEAMARMKDLSILKDVEVDDVATAQDVAEYTRWCGTLLKSMSTVVNTWDMDDDENKKFLATHMGEVYKAPFVKVTKTDDEKYTVSANYDYTFSKKKMSNLGWGDSTLGERLRDLDNHVDRHHALWKGDVSKQVEAISALAKEYKALKEKDEHKSEDGERVKEELTRRYSAYVYAQRISTAIRWGSNWVYGQIKSAAKNYEKPDA